MLKLKLIPNLLTIISKIDLEPVIEKLKNLDIFSEGQTKLDNEQALILASELFSVLAPQLSKIANDIIPFISKYKDIEESEAEELDSIEIFKEILQDNGILDFFKKALRDKVEQES